MNAPATPGPGDSGSAAGSDSEQGSSQLSVTELVLETEDDSTTLTADNAYGLAFSIPNGATATLRITVSHLDEIETVSIKAIKITSGVLKNIVLSKDYGSTSSRNYWTSATGEHLGQYALENVIINGVEQFPAQG